MSDQPTNATRAEWVSKSLDTFTNLTFNGNFRETADAEGVKTVLRDFVADLMHLCDLEKVDFNEIVSRASCHYEEEVEEERSSS